MTLFVYPVLDFLKHFLRSFHVSEYICRPRHFFSRPLLMSFGCNEKILVVALILIWFLAALD